MKNLTEFCKTVETGVDPLLLELVQLYQNWRCGVSNPGPSACKADAPPLSYTPRLASKCWKFAYRS